MGKTNEMNAGNSGESPVRLPFDLRLRSLRSSRQSYARLLRAYSRGEIEEQTFRTLIWAMAGFLNYLKTDGEQAILDRLDVIEKRLTEAERKGGEKGGFSRSA